MKDLISFPILLCGFFFASALIHQFVNISGLRGLPSFLLYCVPLLGVISYTTCREGEHFLHSLGRNAFWGYTFILAISGLAAII